MDRYGRCKFCRRTYLKNPRVKNQQYCNRTNCQRARKRRWQRHKMATDPDYRQNQIDCMRRWRKRNPRYWQEYRKRGKSYSERNRRLQTIQNMKRSLKPLIAKMDASISKLALIPGTYYLLNKQALIAKKDAFFQKVFILPATYATSPSIAK